MGLTRFRVRGVQRVQSALTLCVLTDNMLRAIVIAPEVMLRVRLPAPPAPSLRVGRRSTSADAKRRGRRGAPLPPNEPR